MRPLDFSPLYRSTVGFDHLASLLDSITSDSSQGSGYPPYNIERLSDNEYKITMAVAGFDESNLSIESKGTMLTVNGSIVSQPEDKESSFLHRGIAARSFERRFQLADFVEVKSASLSNGLLHIDLIREIPEAMKPRTIEITSKSGKTQAKLESRKK